MNNNLSALKPLWHMFHPQSTNSFHFSIFLSTDHNLKNFGHVCSLLKIKKRGDPTGSPPVAGLTGFCNAITVFIIFDF